MSFFIYDMIFLSMFVLFLVIFLYKNRKKVKRQGILFLYHTQLGVRFIDYIGRKYRKFLLKIRNVIIVTGYLLMIGMIFLLARIVWIFSKPELVKIIKIPPILPLIPYLPELFKLDFLPPFYFTYYIIVIAVIAVSHEFAHGIYARLANIKVKSTGFGFLGPFLAAFVEPDEKKMEKVKKKEQLSILCAGTFANVIMAILFYIIIALFFMAFFVPSGVVFGNYALNNIDVSSIEQIGGLNISDIGLKEAVERAEPELNTGNVSFVKVKAGENSYFLEKNIDINESDTDIVVYEDAPAIRAGLKGNIVEIDGIKISEYKDLVNELAVKKPGQEISVKTNYEDEILEYNVELIENPKDKSKAFLGIVFFNYPQNFISKIVEKLAFFRKPNTSYLPRYNSDLILFIFNLFWWIILVNIGVAFFNMLPVGIFDGGRVFYISMLVLLKNKNRARIAYKIANLFLLFILVLLMMLWIFGIS